jgi:hypothetical protein
MLEKPEGDPVIRALYSPGKREVACVLIQAAFGGDRRACTAIHDWCVVIEDDFRMISAPLSKWREIGDLPKDERPGPEFFQPKVEG